MLPLLTRRCEDNYGGIKVKDFFLLKGESDRKCQLTGGYTTNARWDKGDARKEKREGTVYPFSPTRPSGTNSALLAELV